MNAAAALELELEPKRERAPTPALRVQRHHADAVLEQRAIAHGLTPVAARVLASRGLASDTDLDRFIRTPLSALSPPDTLADIDTGANRLAMAVIVGEHIAIQTDYDTDGLGAHAAFLQVMTGAFGHPVERIHSIVGNRLTEGYGLTEPVAARILALDARPGVLVTADNGSSDEARIALLANEGIDVIVTDHHLIPDDVPPPSAYAVINPQRTDCQYPDKAIAGGMVTWLLLAATRRILIECGHPVDTDSDALAAVLDYVACSTVADCVSLASVNNRAVVNRGLRLIAARRRPCWQGMAPFLGNDRVTAQTIGFGIGPRIHARTRLAEPMAALHFLMAQTPQEGTEWAERLDADNNARKAIERDILDSAIAGAEQAVAQGHLAVTLFLENAHPGVQGICSSRIVERFGRPALLCSPTITDPAVLTGSARAIDELHFRDALEHVDKRHPGLMSRYGGHRAAAGVTLPRESFEAFREALETAVGAQITTGDVGPRIVTDGELSPDEMRLATVDDLAALEPFGRGFEAPRFEGAFLVVDAKPIGDGTHQRLILSHASVGVKAVWFRARASVDDEFPCDIGDKVRLVYEIDDNVWNRARSLQLKIVARIA